MRKEIFVAFIDEKLKKDFEALNESKFEDKQLYGFIDRAMDDIKNNPICGTRLKKKQWPKKYILDYAITNLWKYDLPNSWRLVYTIEATEVKIVNMILEWFDHKNYERRFSY